MIIKIPGLIDPHVHLRDLGQTEKEDFFTGTAAALAGGFTLVVDMPNNSTPITTIERLKEKQQAAQEKIVSDIGFHFGTLGDNLDEFNRIEKEGRLASTRTGSSTRGWGVLGLKIYLNQTTGNYLLGKEHLPEIFRRWPGHLPILFHAEEKTFDEVLEVLRKYPRKAHLAHLSTAYELKKVMEAKSEGLPITCGVTPHHLFLNENDEKVLGPFGMMRPPLRPQSDVDFLWKNLKAIDCVESDHAPHTLEEKQSKNPPNGIPGLETTLPLLLTAVSEGKLTIDEVIRLCHDGPSRILGIKQDEGNFIEIDTEAVYEIRNENLQTKSKWTPFHGLKATGKVVATYLHGREVYRHGKVLAEQGTGTIVERAS